MTDENTAENLEQLIDPNDGDWVELGGVKKDTRGHIFGYFYDGGQGFWG